MVEVLSVGLGGFLGAISRYIISMQASRLFTGRIPIGTLCVNIRGITYRIDFRVKFKN